MADRDAASAGELDDRFGVPLDDELIAGLEVIGFLGEDQAAETGGSAAGEDRQGDIGGGAEPPRRALGRLTAGLRLAAALSLQLSEALRAGLRRWTPGAQLRARRMRAAGLLLVAVLVSVGAGIGLRSWLPQKRVPQQTEAAPVALPAPTKSVLVARQSVARGGIVRASDIAWQPWLTDRIKPSYIVLGTRNAAEFYGFVARVPLAPGEPLSEDKIVSLGEHGSLTAMLRPGMRAISIGITHETAASGLILPGDSVDVLFAMPVPEIVQSGAGAVAYNHRGVQEILVEARVLAIGQITDAGEHQSVLADTATLEVTPKQAEIVALADFIAYGKLYLGLDSLASERPESEQPSADVVAQSHTVDADVSKYYRRRYRHDSSASVTIVRRGEATRSGS